MGGPTVLAHGTRSSSSGSSRRWPGAGISGVSCSASRAPVPTCAASRPGPTRDGDEFVVTGQKVWNSGADVGDWGMLLARTDPDDPKQRGITWMMIDMRQPGVEARPLVQMNGAAEFCEVFLTEARGQVGDVIGDLNDGWNVARTTLPYERATAAGGRGRGLVTVAAGACGRQLDRPVGEMVERGETGRHAAEQAIATCCSTRGR